MRTLGHPYSSTLKHHWAQSTCPRSANKPALPIRSASGEATGVVPRPLPDQATQQLADLVARCPQIIDMIGAERQREKRGNPQRRAVLAGNTHVLGQKRLNAVSTEPAPVHIGEQRAFDPRPVGSFSHSCKAPRACTVSGVHLSFRPLPTHRTWAPAPRWMAS